MQDPVLDLITRLRREADAADFSHLATPAIRPNRRGFALLRTRAAATVASAVFGVLSLGGVAYAANGAAPGDLLYGLDRALEQVGIGRGGAAERISEAIDLAAAGQTGPSLEHVVVVLPDEASDQAEEALLHAAEVSAAAGPADQAAVQEQVLALLAYLEANRGAIDGATVAELAGAIGGSDGEPGPPDGVPADPPDDPGQGTGSPPSSIPPGPPTTTSTSTTTTSTTIPLP